MTQINCHLSSLTNKNYPHNEFILSMFVIYLYIVRPETPCRLLARSRMRIDTRRASSNLARTRHVNASNCGLRDCMRNYVHVIIVRMARARRAAGGYPCDRAGTHAYAHACCAYARTRNYCTSARKHARKHALHVEAKIFGTLYMYCRSQKSSYSIAVQRWFYTTPLNF